MTSRHVLYSHVPAACPTPETVRNALYTELTEIERDLRGLRILHQNLLRRRGDILVDLRGIDEPVSEIAARLGVSRGTIDKTLRNHRPGHAHATEDDI